MRLFAVRLGVPEMLTYIRRVLDALGVRNGPATCKLILTATGPCLLSARPCVHGGNGVRDAVAMRCLGYSQTSAIS